MPVPQLGSGQGIHCVILKLFKIWLFRNSYADNSHLLSLVSIPLTLMLLCQ